MININLAFTGNKINNKQLNNDKLELSRAKEAALKDLKLTQLDEDVVDFSYEKAKRDNRLYESLDEEIIEMPEDDELAEFDNFFRDYELEENAPKDPLKNEMGEFYYETQYDENDVPLSESIKPYRNLSVIHLSPYSYAQDTILDYESKHALNRLNYSERIHARSRLKDDTSNVSEISELAATLAEKKGKYFADRCVDMSILKQANGSRALNPNLFRFVSKYPGHRNHVVNVSKNGTETYNAAYGRAYIRMLEETNDVNTIKKVLASGVLENEFGEKRQDSTLTHFAVDVFKNTQNWGPEEEMLIHSVKKTGKTLEKGLVIQEQVVDYSKLRQAEELLDSDANIEECIIKLNNNNK